MTRTLEEIRKKINKELHKFQIASAELEHAEQKFEEAKKDFKAKTKAQKIIQTVAQEVQQQVHNRIAGIVTRCIEAVFDDPYEFKILFEQKRGKTEARLVFVRDGEEYVPNDSSGGGVIDVAAFALRLSCLVLTRPPLRRLLVLDEPFKNVNGAENQERVGKMVSMITDELNVQIIMVTDDDWLKIGKVIEVRK